MRGKDMPQVKTLPEPRNPARGLPATVLRFKAIGMDLQELCESELCGVQNHRRVAVKSCRLTNCQNSDMHFAARAMSE